MDVATITVPLYSEGEEYFTGAIIAGVGVVVMVLFILGRREEK